MGNGAASSSTGGKPTSGNRARFFPSMQGTLGLLDCCRARGMSGTTVPKFSSGGSLGIIGSKMSNSCCSVMGIQCPSSQISYSGALVGSARLRVKVVRLRSC